VRLNLKALILASIAIAAGVIVLLGYFIPLPVLADLRITFLHWAVILSAVALWLGVFNLVRIHFGKIQTRQVGLGYSYVLLFSLVLTIAIVWISTPAGEWSLWIFNNIQVPIESSLMALLAVVLIFACIRLLKKRVNLLSLIFVGTVVFILAGTVSLPGMEIPLLGELRSWIIQVWAAAGARGILLGVGLGTIATGLRILMGADRPYGG
jgi:hypothetical protein